MADTKTNIKRQLIVFKDLGLTGEEIALIRTANNLGHNARVKTTIDPATFIQTTTIKIQFSKHLNK